MTGAVGAIGAAAVAWPFLDTLNPSADVLALNSQKSTLAPVQPGQSDYRHVARQTSIHSPPNPAEIDAAGKVNLSELVDPQPDFARVPKPESFWLAFYSTWAAFLPDKNGRHAR